MTYNFSKNSSKNKEIIKIDNQKILYIYIYKDSYKIGHV